MALDTFVKVGEISNLSDARYCAGMGVHVLGFSLEPEDAHYTDPEKYAAITGWLAGVAFAAEFDRSSPADIEKTLAAYSRINYIQTTQPSYVSSLQPLGKSIIIRLDAARYEEDVVALADVMRDCHEQAAYFLVENSSSARRVDLLNDLLHLAKQYAILLGFGLNPRFVPSLVKQHPLAGIALRGSQEIRPGYQNFDELADILEALEVE